MDDDLKETLKALTDELRVAREHRESSEGRAWYERAPFEHILSHGVTLCLASVIAWFIHTCTGQAVTVEAKSSHVPEVAPATSIVVVEVPVAAPVSSVRIEAPRPAAVTPAAP